MGFRVIVFFLTISTCMLSKDWKDSYLPDFGTMQLVRNNEINNFFLEKIEDSKVVESIYFSWIDSIHRPPTELDFNHLNGYKLSGKQIKQLQPNSCYVINHMTSLLIGCHIQKDYFITDSNGLITYEANQTLLPNSYVKLLSSKYLTSYSKYNQSMLQILKIILYCCLMLFTIFLCKYSKTVGLNSDRFVTINFLQTAKVIYFIQIYISILLINICFLIWSHPLVYYSVISFILLFFVVSIIIYFCYFLKIRGSINESINTWLNLNTIIVLIVWSIS